jgi:hypothetical protein
MRISSFFVVAAAVAFPAFAQQEMKVEGLVIELGVMPAEKAVHALGHAQAHPEKFPSGSQHLLITVAEQKSGRRLGDADVVVEVVDPKGKIARKALIHTSAAGMPDYSELFIFGWSGEYSVRVNVTPWAGAKPVKTSFTVHHQI